MGRIKDLKWQRFGRWTVLECAGVNKRNKSLWLCRCDCGTERVVSSELLRRGRSQSCGCLNKERRAEARKAKLEDLTGQKFGRLTAVSRYGFDEFGRQLWTCECECGNTIVAHAYSLKQGHTKSCGCLKKEKATANLPSNQVGERCPSYKHGGEGTRLYNIWKGMKRRCYNEHDSSYENYGGRGITVCDEWRNDFIPFRDWALSNGYSDDLSIDRIDNDQGYGPDNCRWADRITQRANQRPHKPGHYSVRVKCLETGEIFDSLKSASEKTGAPRSSISSCLKGKLKRAGGLHWAQCE